FFAVILFLSMSIETNESLRIDFGNEKIGQDWQIIVDGVMGGLSAGNKQVNSNSLLFTGNVSLANNGGFSSCKGPFTRTDLSHYNSLLIRCKGAGQVFAVTLENDRRWYAPYFKSSFEPGTEWQTIELPLANFDLYQIGRKLGKGPSTEALAATLRIGITTNAKKEGPFELEIDYIEFR
ncbi:MAG: CIA30 family protein, partial [Bacteroidota bacterium]